MTVGGMIVCRNCQRGWLSISDVGLQHTDGELCPICRTMETAPPPTPDPPAWGIAPPPSESAHDALEELLGEVRRDEANWRLDDKIDLALGIRRDEPRKGK